VQISRLLTPTGKAQLSLPSSWHCSVLHTTWQFSQIPWHLKLPGLQLIAQLKMQDLVHKALIGQAPDYITNLLTPVTNIPSHCSLRASSNGNLF